MKERGEKRKKYHNKESEGRRGCKGKSGGNMERFGSSSWSGRDKENKVG